MPDSRDSTGQTGPQVPDALARTLAGRQRLADRFEVLRWLGEGGMGAVYLAQDEKLGRKVALKLLLGADPDGLARFKREFRALADISHPNLIVLHELFHAEGTWLFSMDYVEGQDFLSYVSAIDARHAPTLLEVEAHRMRARGQGRESWGRPRCPVRDERVLRSVMLQLCEAVRALHAANKLHLDLKPSNVLVSQSGHVTVLDFGLARDLGQSATVRTQRVLGTPAYMSPEQALGQPFAQASDWYAVGVMLYEALTGRLPYEGSIPEILHAKCARDPVPPSQLASGVPGDLEALCMALLARNADARPNGDAIVASLGARPEPARPRPRVDTTAELFVGREHMLRALREDSVDPSSPHLLLLYGGSGVGKSTLARRFLRELAADEGTLVLHGACYEREALPFKAFDGVVDELVAKLSLLDPDQLGPLLPRHPQALSRLFPAFAKLQSLGNARRMPDDDDPQVGRARAFRAFAELFGRLSDRKRVVVFIDDLHWGDVDSALLLRELFEGNDPVPMLLLGTYRPAEAADSPFFRELASLEHKAVRTRITRVEVDALGRDEARMLAEQLLGTASEAARALARHIADESHGVPLFVHELVRHTAFERAPNERPISLSEALGERMTRLPDAARRLLDVIAIAGRPIAQRLAQDAAGLAFDAGTVHTLRAAGFAKSRGALPEDAVETYHDRIREVVVARMSAERRKVVHAALLDVLERVRPGDYERLLEHSLGAERHERALAYAERAAGAALELLAFHRAAELYRSALDCQARVGKHDPERRAHLLEGLADALAAGGYCLDAARAYLAACELVPARTAWLERQAANQLLRGGDLEQGIALLKRVLAQVGVAYPAGSRTALAQLALERARLYTRGLDFEERAPERIDEAELEVLETLRIALGVYWLVEPVRGAVFATQYLRRALDAGHARHVLRGLESEGAYLALMGGGKAEAKAAEIYAASAALTKRIGHAGTRAGHRFAEAGFHAIYGRKHKSAECALEALAQPNQGGLSWELPYARFHVYQASLYIGGKPGLADELERFVEEAEARSDRFAAATLLPMLAMGRLMANEPARAHRALERMRPMLSPEVFSFLDVQETIWTALSHGYEGDYEAAVAHYERRHGRYAASGMPRLQVWRTLLTWGSLLAHLGALGRDPSAAQHRSAALERVKSLEREGIAWPRAFASAGRAALAHLADRPLERDEALARAIREADELGYHPFAALYARAAAYLATDAVGIARQDARLYAWGVADPAAWQRLWAPGFTPDER